MKKKMTLPTIEDEALVRNNLREVTELNNRLKVLVRSIGLITGASSTGALGRKLLKEFALNMGAEGGSLYLLTHEALELTHCLDPGHAEESIPLPLSPTSVFGRVLEKKMPVIIQDIRGEIDPRPSGWTKYTNGSLMAFPLFDGDGETFGLVTLHNKAYPPFTDQDREIGAILVSFCCEALKGARAVNSLRESEAKYRKLVENMNDAVYSVDADGKVTYVSPGMEKITGYAASEGLGFDFKSSFNAREASQLGQNFKKCLNGEPTSGEYRMHKKSGEPIWVRTSSQPIWEGDKVVGLQGILMDITESKKAAQRLEANAAELAILNSLGKAMGADLSVESAIKSAIEHLHRAIEPDFSVLFLKEGDTLLPRFSTPFSDGFPEEDVPAHRVGECLCGLAVEERRAVYSVNIHTDPRCTYEECRMAGFHSFAALPLMTGGDMVGVLGMASRREREFQGLATFLGALSSEISIGLKNAILYEKAQNDSRELKKRLKKIQESEEEKRSLTMQLQQTQKMEAIGTLAGGIAHDFNNILGGMIGYTELALVNVSFGDEKLRGYLNKILVSCNRAKDLVQQILKFSRRDGNAMAGLAIKPILKESVKLLRSTLPSYIELRERINAEADGIVGDPTQIHQIIMNLCTNAYHAVREGGGMTVSLENETFHEPKDFMSFKVPPGEYVKLSVEDTGHGIPIDIQARIFEPYFTTKKINEGTGLGLAVVLGIIKSHNGLMQMDSTPGKGSRFDVYLPLRDSVPLDRAGIIQDFPKGNGEKVLVVDDEEFFLDILREHLEGVGYRVTANRNSSKILEIFREEPKGFDLVITDQAMPEMTGVQLVSEIRKLNRDVPVILCTGYSESVSEQTIKHYRINKFLMKPITRRDLAEAVHDVLD
ncbi:MAG: GAF domain-containing protein [Deltaproteobacteria bacterium]|nr:GAF domain-containing protein [Deltaproteobacteria bacterium]